MTEEAQRIAIAELCLWMNIEKRADDPDFTGLIPHGGRRLLPDYLRDLNAMHKAEKMLTFDDGLEPYAATLSRIQCRDFRTAIPAGQQVAETDVTLWTFHATAAQRAEAFLRAKGLWVD